MPSHARQVVDAIHSRSVRAMSVEAMYGIDSDGNAFHINAPQPRVESQRHNEKGRCTSASYLFEDGSRVAFSFSENRGARYLVQEAKPVSSVRPGARV